MTSDDVTSIRLTPAQERVLRLLRAKATWWGVDIHVNTGFALNERGLADHRPDGIDRSEWRITPAGIAWCEAHEEASDE